MKKIIIVLLISFLTLELSARVDDYYKYGANIIEPYTRDRIILIDEYGETGKPNSRFEKWRINNFGLRGEDIEKEKPEDEIRILCLGASETFGSYESEENEWPRIFENLLKEQGYNVEVLNAGHVGRSLKGNIVRARGQWMNLKPDIVVLYMSFYNYFYTERRGKQDKQKVNETINIPIWKWSRILDKIDKQKRKFIPKKLLDWYDEIDLKKEIEANKKKDKRQLEADNMVVKEKIYKDLDELLEICEEGGAELVLVVHESGEDEIGLLHRRTFNPLMNEKDITENNKIQNSILREYAKKRKLPLVDSEELLPLYDEDFADSVHFTDEGAKKLATNIAEKIIKTTSPQRAKNTK